MKIKNKRTVLPLSFFSRDTINVSRELLGKLLVKITDNKRISGIIVETEAYLGTEDSSCHSFNNRRTPRNEAMYLPGGHCYVYFIYGMHFCFNIVSNKKNFPEAILIRAVEPLEGINTMKKYRNKNNYLLTNGPAKICQAFNIDRKTNCKPLIKGEIFIEDIKLNIHNNNIVEKERVGIGNIHDSVYWPLRFYIKNNPYVSLK